MNRDILKAKIAEVISSTNKSGNEKLEAILAVVDAYSSADNGAKPVLAAVLSKYIQYIREVEGADYILDWDERHMADVQFTDEEWAILTEAAKNGS